MYMGNTQYEKILVEIQYIRNIPTFMKVHV